MRYASVCSGIEAASVAWHPLGWQPVFFSEIASFPRAVLEQRWPNVPNLGDMAGIRLHWMRRIGIDGRSIDVLVGGTPCQGFSVAGLRGGLDDERSNLALEFLRLARRTRSRWLVWENVPGVLSINGGRDFGTFLGGLAQLGYGWAYRVMDAQYFGVAQRRRRVFVVGYLGDWRRAAAVLFERESLSGNPAPRRAPREVASTLFASGAGTERPSGTASELGFIVESASALTSSDGGVSGKDGVDGRLIADTFRLRSFGDYENDGVASSLQSRDHKGATDLIIPFDQTQITSPLNRSRAEPGDPAPTLGVHAYPPSFVPAVADPLTEHERDSYTHEGNNFRTRNVVAFKPSHFTRGKDGAPNEITGPLCADSDRGDNDAVVFEARVARNGRGAPSEKVPPLKAQSGATGKGDAAPLIASAVAMPRRLTPRECERLQGFPDDYTLIEYNRKPALDGPRYMALGNSMAVPVMRWIGERIQKVEQLSKELELQALR